MRVVALALGLAACGGNSWTDADAKSASDVLRAQQVLLNVCEADAGCTPGTVRAVERATTCSLGSMLHRHGDPAVVDPKACRQ